MRVLQEPDCSGQVEGSDNDKSEYGREFRVVTVIGLQNLVQPFLRSGEQSIDSKTKRHDVNGQENEKVAPPRGGLGGEYEGRGDERY